MKRISNQNGSLDACRLTGQKHTGGVGALRIRDLVVARINKARGLDLVQHTGEQEKRDDELSDHFGFVFSPSHTTFQ